MIISRLQEIFVQKNRPSSNIIVLVGRFFQSYLSCESSENLQLHRSRSQWFAGFPPQIDSISILFIGNFQNCHMTLRRNILLYSIDVYVSILVTWAMPDIDRKLHHSEPVRKQTVSELTGKFSFLLGVGWQIEKYVNPHGSIGV